MSDKARIVGINHVALEVGSIEEALSFYGQVFQFSLRGRGEKMAFIDMGDQFIALFEGQSRQSDAGRHFGLVVDDREKVRERCETRE
jgi:catechol 2,3-dioxygenase-like lactoylglutathione lyase family enzyme